MVFSYVLSSSFLFMLTYRLLQILRPAQREPLRLTSASLLGAPQSGAANQTIRSVANHAKQTEAIAEFFGDRKLVDLRVLRSAMALSKEVQQAVHAETPSMGWRRYNRFFAAGTEELFTNVPSGRSPLVLKAPPEPSSSFPTMFPSIESIEYDSILLFHFFPSSFLCLFVEYVYILEVPKMHGWVVGCLMSRFCACVRVSFAS
ncbi:Type II secretion system (T2SS)-associated protein Gcp10 [Andalucia godoyi]|uniref:Type II secretion system (T2SS)-associated protein Gcp10 n=1 Tax=Andalucia godoyi TaxID=505711 RepID=A0A8K0F237_ANDGO|nr:Type II secretion system (T2SS)-associated protein Gcp10 [Andalucia godoyi]KAF0852448.1 Type II secretion system (T2SS)-associated protein Gcp10 [Andalucia godoyi]|eukprot:ANDGO_00094.mRNA.2 Type II secretion system (T2SS)-associated protein Gcp10